MTYVVSDLHGDYQKFQALLQKIHFADKDTMYILGDLVDFGDQSMELIADLSIRTNIFPIAGEHDFRAARLLSAFDKLLRTGSTPTPEFIAEMNEWIQEGGKETLEGFRALNAEEREGVLDYLADLPLFEETEVEGETYLMVHAGISDYDKDSDLEDYSPEDFFSETPDPEFPLVPGVTLVVGHIPTENKKITRGNGSIYLDCGVENGDRLGCLCLDTGEEFYA